MKIDLEKAYNRMEWEFVQETLSEVGIPRYMAIVIMGCISGIFRVLRNGRTLDQVDVSRGLCQGILILLIYLCCVWSTFHI